MNANGPYAWKINTGSGRGLVGSGTKPFITWANADPDLCFHMVLLGQNELIHPASM